MSKTQNYDLFKAIRESAENNLTGYEREMHQEAEKEFRAAGQSLNGLGVPSMAWSQRADVTTGTTGAVSQVEQMAGLDIIKAPTLSDKLGIRKLTGLQGEFDIFSHGQQTASFVGEGAAVPEATYAPGKETIKPRRVGLTKPFTKEYFAQTNVSVHRDFIADFMAAIDAAVDKDLFAYIQANAPVLAGYVATDPAAVPGIGLLVDLETALDVDSLADLAYVTTRGMKGLLKQIQRFSNSGIAIWGDGDQVNGYKGHGTSYVSSDLGAGSDQHAMIFGSWSKAVIGQWGTLEIIPDIYTYKREGKIEVTVNGLFDSGLKNTAAFIQAQNLATA